MVSITKHGTVTVKRVQLGDDTHVSISDTFGYRKETVMRGVALHEVPVEDAAEIHRRYSQTATRRN